jgi:hypothetical protein
MTQTIKARYYAGKLEPLEPLALDEGQEVTLTLTSTEPAPGAGEPFTTTAGAWAGGCPRSGRMPDDFEELVSADRRRPSPREEARW